MWVGEVWVGRYVGGEGVSVDLHSTHIRTKENKKKENAVFEL